MLEFLKYLSDKKFTGAELMVLTIIYKDTRFGKGCFKTVRTLADNTPFDVSKSSVSNAVRSLLKKGYIERLYDPEQDALYLKAVNVECERVIKQPYDVVVEHPEHEKQAKRKKFVPPTYDEVLARMTDRLIHYFGENVQKEFIESQTTAFIDYWQNLEWKDKSGCYIKSVNNRIATWTKNTAEKYSKEPEPYRKASVLSVQVVQPVSIEDIVDAIRAIYAPMQFTENWENERKTALMEQQARAFYAQMTKKNWQLNTGCNTWQDQLQIFAADPFNTLKVLDPDYIPKNKQEREFRNELYTGSKNCDPVSKDGLKTLALIQRLRKQRQEKENANK